MYRVDTEYDLIVEGHGVSIITLLDMLEFLVLIIVHHLLNGIKLRVIFGKNIEKKLLCHHDKNYCYFCKSNIPVMKLIVGSRNMIKLSKNMSKKLDKRRESFSPNTDNFLAFFIIFDWGRILESAMDK